jgi:hypothetical protein
MADLSKLREALKEMDSSDSEADFRRASEQVIKEARKVVRVREIAVQADAQPAAPAAPESEGVGELCVHCGQPTMHDGRACYACCQSAAKPGEATP